MLLNTDAKAKIRSVETSFPLTFEEWLDTNCKMSPIKYMETKYDKDKETQKYLSDYLEEKIKLGKKLALNNHDAYHPVFISAPTGAGKNYFLVHNILGPLLDKNMKYETREQILLLSNRVALGRQTKLDIAKFIRDWTGNSKYEKAITTRTDEGLDEVHDFGDIIMYSYQQMVDSNIDFSGYNIRYVIFDECHFFTSDAAFNPATGSILNTLMERFCDATRLYMSSTMETAFEPIIRLEVSYYRNTDYARNRADKRLFVSYYDMSRHYDYLKIKSWEKNKDIIDKIQDNNDKWLIFVSNKSDGNTLKESIKKEIPDIGVEFITAESKESKIYKEIIKKEKFPDNLRVLITTAVIDNGVNIKDDNVKNIVIDVPDRVEFIQMLGRVRIDKKTKSNQVNLYVREYKLDTLIKCWQNEAKELIKRLNYEINDIIPREIQSRFFEIKEAHVNPLSKYQILTRMDDLRRMILAIDSNATLVLNESERDLQVQIFNHYYYKNDVDVLGRRICNALRDVMKGRLKEGITKTEISVHVAPVLKEKSFLQLIQEKRASSLEHDAIKFIEKYTKYNYDKYREERIKDIVNYQAPSLAQDLSPVEKLKYAYNQNGFCIDQFKYTQWWNESMQKYPPDKLVDVPWNDSDLWEKLELAYKTYCLDNPEGEQPIPNPEYMEEQCNLYRSLSNNELGSDNPVLMEQLHWLDIDSLNRIEDEDEYSVIEENNAMEDNEGEGLSFGDGELSDLLMNNAYSYEEVKEKKDNVKQYNDWILQHGYSNLVLKNIEKGTLNHKDIDKQYNRDNNHKMMPKKHLLALFNYFKIIYEPKDNENFTFRKLKNKLDNKPYEFQYEGKKYEFTIMNINAREYGDNATYYIFCKKEI